MFIFHVSFHLFKDIDPKSIYYYHFQFENVNLNFCFLLVQKKKFLSSSDWIMIIGCCCCISLSLSRWFLICYITRFMTTTTTTKPGKKTSTTLLLSNLFLYRSIIVCDRTEWMNESSSFFSHLYGQDICREYRAQNGHHHHYQ